MIRLSRLPLGATLADQLLILTSQIANASVSGQKAYARTLWSRREPRRTIRSYLDAMAPGLQRCMYCGDNQGNSVDHFEPITRNPLRTFDWLNHLLACTFCNSNLKGSLYPVDANDRPLLIDPTVDDPFDHLVLSLSVGEYRATTAKGLATLDVLQLNRAVLTEGRIQARVVVTQALLLWQAYPEQRPLHLQTMRMQPLADVLQAMLRYAYAPGARNLFDPNVLNILRHPALRADLC